MADVVSIHAEKPHRKCPLCGFLLTQLEIELIVLTKCPNCLSAPLSEFKQDPSHAQKSYTPRSWPRP